MIIGTIMAVFMLVVARHYNTTSVGVVTKRLQCLQVMFKFSVDLIGRSGFFLPPL